MNQLYKAAISFLVIVICGCITNTNAQTSWIPSLLGPLESGSVQVSGNDTSTSMVTAGGGATGQSSTIMSALGALLDSSGSWLTLSSVSEYYPGVYGLTFSCTRNTGTQTRSWYFFYGHTRYTFTQPVGTVATLTVSSNPEYVFPGEKATVTLALSNTISGDTYILSNSNGETLLSIPGNGGSITKVIPLPVGDYSLSGINSGNTFQVNHYQFVDNPPVAVNDTLLLASTISTGQIVVQGYDTSSGTSIFTSASEAIAYLEPLCDWCNTGRNPAWRKGYSLSPGYINGNGLLQVDCNYPNYAEHNVVLSVNLPEETSNPSLTVIHSGADIPSLSQGYNFILTSNYMDDAVIRQVSYFDGLGNETQTTDIRASGNGQKDIITLHSYDSHLRENASWLPYARVQTPGIYDSCATANHSIFYTAAGFSSTDAASAFGENTYEPSSLDRMRSASLPGYNYHLSSHTSRVSYSFNSANDIPLLSISTFGDLLKNGYVLAKTLICIHTVDGNGAETDVYTDKEGRIICEDRWLDSNTKARTLYVYDNFGRPVWIVQPEGVSIIASTGSASVSYMVSSDFAKRWCFVYIYDKRSRVIKKRIPGSDWIEFVYDKADRPVMNRDGNLALSNKWKTVKYDQFGRVVQEGVTQTLRESETREVLQAAFDAGTNPSCWSTPDKLLRECTYDNYPIGMGSVLEFEGVEGITMISNSSLADSRVNGLITWEKIYSVDGINNKQQSFYYDNKARLIRKAVLYSNGGFNVQSQRYDYEGNVVRSNEISSPMGINSGINSLDKTYAYNSQGRLQSIVSSLNGGSSSTISYTYDDLGRLSSKQHQSTGGYTVTENYTYTLQGWENGHTAYSGNSTLFLSELAYDNPLKNGTPDWMGKISSWHWAQESLYDRIYTYNYDGLSRLVDADQYSLLDQTPENLFSEKDISYDLNGNILSLTRSNGSAVITPNVVFSYSDGNHRDNYLYDASGNVTMENEEGLYLTYNILNLPSSISDGNSVLANYGYMADGEKRSTLDSSGSGFLYDGSFKYENLGNNAYSIESVTYEGGRFVPSSTGNGGNESQIFITDHLGSVRTVISANGTILQQNEYLPYGELLNNSYTDLSNNDYLYTGKEQQRSFDINLYDSQARFQSLTGTFLSIDPMAEKYYNTTPYAYCANNPVNFVDPEGRDIWEVDNEGRIVSYKHSTESDTFYIVDKEDNGNIIRRKDDEGNDISISFKYGTVENTRSITFSPDNNKTVGIYDIIQVRGDSNGKALFEFFSENVTARGGTNANGIQIGIEYGLFQTGIEGDKGLNFITTSHTNNREYGQKYLYEGQLCDGYYIRKSVHSHPTNSKASSSDEKAFRTIIEYQKARGWLPPITGIYYVGSDVLEMKNKYIYYE